MKKRLFIGFSVALALMFAARTIHVQAQGSEFAFYITDTFPDKFPGARWVEDGKTKLWRVTLDSGTGHANLQELASFPGATGKKGNKVAALATTLDGAYLYAWDTSGETFKYDVSTDSITYMGTMKTPSGANNYGSPTSAFSSDGDLYSVNTSEDALYFIDLNALKASKIGPIETPGGNPVDAYGADIVFTPDGTLYLWTNRASTGAPAGLYRLTIPEIITWLGTDIVLAEFVGPSDPSGLPGKELGLPHAFTRGLAVSIDDSDVIYLSVGPNDNQWNKTAPELLPPTSNIYSVSILDGSISVIYPMYVGSNRYWTYGRGDATAGPLVLCTKTIGYWKNHSWNGEKITICGVTISENGDGINGEVDGKEILWNARGKNHSMLFAQLIAAKLNTYNWNGFPEIDDAENYICANLGGNNWLQNVDSSISKGEKSYVSSLWEALDAFNNMYECDED